MAAAQDSVRMAAGRVLDPEGRPLKGVSVKVMADSTRIVGFAITSASGEYKVKIDPAKKPWRLMFSSVGHESQWREIPQNRMEDVRMQPGAKELPEVAVKGRPIFSKGDTIVYDVASFTGAADRNLEDVLAKLPGIHITSNGSIEYNGETINRFYIEGLNMLGGRYSLATRNVRPQDVNKVEVLENHQPVKALRDVAPSTKAAINITLKKRSMMRPVGNAKGGGGVDQDGYGLWVGEMFGMGIAPTIQTMLTLKANDVGLNYTFENYDFLRTAHPAGAAASRAFSDRPFGSAPVARERYSYNRTMLASANALKKLSADATLKITATYAYDRDRFGNSERIDYSGVAGSDATLSRNTTSKLGAHDATIESTFEQNAPTRHISNTLLLHGIFADNRYGAVGAEAVDQNTRRHQYEVANGLELTFRRGRDAYSIKSNIALTNVPLNTLTATMGADGKTRVGQSVKGLSFKTTESTMLSWAPGNAHYIGVRINFDAQYQTYSSSGTASDFESRNQEHGFDITTSVSPEYQLLLPHSSRLTVRIPLALYNMRFVDELTCRASPANKLGVNWNVVFNTPAWNAYSFSASVGQTSNFGNFSDFITNPVFSSYNTLSTPGSGLLRHSTSHNASATLSHRNTIKEFFWNVRLSAYRTNNNTLTSTTVGDGGSLSSQSIAAKGLTKGISAAATLSKGISPLRGKVELSLAGNWGATRLMRQELVYMLKNASYSLSLNVGMQPCRWISINITGNGALSHQNSEITGSRSNPTASAGGRISFHPASGWEIYAKPDFRYSELSDDRKPTDLFLDGGVRYSRKRWEVELSLRNLTDRRVYSYRTFNDADEYFYSFTLRPREYLLTLKYNF